MGFTAVIQDLPRLIALPLGAPLLLRGTDRPGHSTSGRKHRAPLIADTGHARLPLRIDPIPGPENHHTPVHSHMTHREEPT